MSEMTPYKSPLGLEYAQWSEGTRYGDNLKFKYGTVEGLLRFETRPATGKCMVVNSVISSDPGNGHFGDFMDMLMHNCKATQMTLVFEAVGFYQRMGLMDGDHRQLARHLKRIGFSNIGGTTDWCLRSSKMK